MEIRTGRLTANQVRVLVAVYGRREKGLGASNTATIAEELATSQEGVGQSTGSLVRRGCLRRTKVLGRVWFELSERGEAVAAPAWRAAARADG